MSMGLYQKEAAVTERFSPEPEASEGELPSEDLYTKPNGVGNPSELPIGDKPEPDVERREPSTPPPEGEPPPQRHPEDAPADQQPPIGDPMPSREPVGDPPGATPANF
jgi:hypothetical protein